MAKLQQITVANEQPLLPFLLEKLGLKRAAVKNLLKFGAVAINGRVNRQFDHPLAIGDLVTIGDPREASAAENLKAGGIQVIHDDDALIVVEKPSGLLTVATDLEKLDTLFVRLNEYLRSRDPVRKARAWVVHRLDQPTSGLVLFAKSEAVKSQLQESWSEVKKTYFAVVEGRPPAEAGTVSNFLSENRKSLKVFVSDRKTPEARKAITHYRLLKSQGARSLLEVRLETGRKHQIRVHLAGLGCPVVGDTRYGETAKPHGRLGLHACRLELPHPVTREMVSVQSSLPGALEKLLSE